jgi:hypothetical protein
LRGAMAAVECHSPTRGAAWPPRYLLPRPCRDRHALFRPPPPRARGAQIRDNLKSFLLGGVTALAAGYYRVHQDVWTTAEAVDGRLDSLGREVVSSQTALQKRVAALEGEIKKLHTNIATMQDKAALDAEAK